ncbi:MAG: hypothetical protein IPK16_11525 [Anaerolineales bacterium]|nr:hypothetical protein [Anaerolineales bacterium]
MADNAEGVTATYSGTVEIAGMQLGIIVAFTVENGEYQGSVGIPAQGVSGIPIHDMVIESNTVHFEMLSGQQLAVFNGTIADDGSVTGTMAQGGYEGTFTIVPISPEGQAASAAEVASTTIFTDASGRFSVPVPTNWVATQEEGYIFLTDPEQELKVSALVLEGDDVEAALDAAWKIVDPAFALPVKEAIDTPSRPGVEKTVAITYDTSDDNRIVQAVGQLKDGVVYVIVFDGVGRCTKAHRSCKSSRPVSRFPVLRRRT